MEAKGILQSKTIWGLILTAAGVAFGWSPELQAAIAPDVADLADKLLTVAGLLWALYGRLAATRPVRLTGTADASPPPPPTAEAAP